MMSQLLIGLNTYRDLPFLKESLPPLEVLRVRLNATVVILDTAWDEEVRRFVQESYPEFHYMRHPDGNIGYGRAYSAILKAFPQFPYFLVVTSDVWVDPRQVDLFVKRMENDAQVMMCSGKVYHWNFSEREKTSCIDTLGIMAQRRHHFYDRGHGELDQGQYDDDLDHFFGVSGAVFLVRTAVIPHLAPQNPPWRLFDDRMWMYKEDIDLSYRLRWLHAKIAIFPEVWAWHARTVSNKEGAQTLRLAQADRGKKDYARLHSYKNHFLLLKNHFSLAYGFKVFLRVFIYEFMKGVHTLILHPRVFISGLKTLLFVPGRRSPRVAKPAEMLAHFES